MESTDDTRIVIAEQLHRFGILELAEHVYNKREPVAFAMNSDWDQAGQMWERKLDLSLQDPPISHVAVNRANKVVGFRLSRIVDMDTYKPENSLYDFIPQGFLRLIHDRVTKDWVEVVNDNGDTCRKVLQFIGLCVHPEYNQRGLGEKMCRENLVNAQQLGCDLCLVVGSNYASQKIFEKLGFKIMGELEYDEYNGDIQMMDHKQRYFRSYFLKLM